MHYLIWQSNDAVKDTKKQLQNLNSYENENVDKDSIFWGKKPLWHWMENFVTFMADWLSIMATSYVKGDIFVVMAKQISVCVYIVLEISQLSIKFIPFVFLIVSHH